MPPIRIIPCLDVKDGKVVKGKQFNNLADVGDPIELARKYNLQKADELVFLDITATNQNRETMIDLASQVAKQIFIPFTIGGGISTKEQAARIIRSGADKVSINSAAVKNPLFIEELKEELGSQCVVVAIDVKKIKDQWIVFTHSGSRNTGLDAINWALEVEARGAGEILLTSMDKDGLTSGYDLEISNLISTKVNIPVVISGGCGKMQDFVDAVYLGKADAILAASVFHYDKMNVLDVKKFMREQGIEVRL